MGNGEIRQSQALHSATHTILRPSRGVIERGRRLELGRTPYGRAWLRILAVSDDSAYCYQMHYLLSYSSDIFPSHFRSRLFCTRICSSLPTLVLAFLPFSTLFRIPLHFALLARSPASPSHCTVRIFGISLVSVLAPVWAETCFPRGLDIHTRAAAHDRWTDETDGLVRRFCRLLSSLECECV